MFHFAGCDLREVPFSFGADGNFVTSASSKREGAFRNFYVHKDHISETDLSGLSIDTKNAKTCLHIASVLNLFCQYVFRSIREPCTDTNVPSFRKRMYAKEQELKGDHTCELFAHWMPLVQLGESVWISELKYHLVHYFAVKSGHLEKIPGGLPKEPQQGILHKGFLPYRLMRALGKCMFRDNAQSLKDEVLFTILQGIKKGMPSVSDNFVDLEIFKTTQELADSLTPPVNEEFMDCLVRTCRELRITEKDRLREAQDAPKVTRGACTEGLTRMGGCRGIAMDLGEMTVPVPKRDKVFPCVSESLEQACGEAGVLLCRSYVQKLLAFKHTATTPYGVVAGINVWNKTYLALAEIYRSISLTDPPFRLSFSHGLDGSTSMCGEVDPTKNKAFMVGIKEPLKVRPITKMNFLTNAMWHDIQIATWKRLRENWQFRLIGESMTSDHIHELLAAHEAVYGELHETLRWNSADYSGATNTIYQIYSEVVCNELYEEEWVKNLVRGNMCSTTLVHFISKKGMRKEVREEWVARLVAAGIEFEQDKDDIWYNTLQRKGQLMGSLFSFPILCVINFAVNRFYHERKAGRHLDLSEVPVIINGDDNLSLMPEEDFTDWLDAIGQVGFRTSVGKNYLAKEFAFLNSKFFRISGVLMSPEYLEDETDEMSGGRWIRTDIRERNYFNFGILTGEKKGSSDFKPEDLHFREDLAGPAQCRPLFQLCPSLAGMEDSIHEIMSRRLDQPAAFQGSADFLLGLSQTTTYRVETRGEEVVKKHLDPYEEVRQYRKEMRRREELREAFKHQYGRYPPRCDYLRTSKISSPQLPDDASLFTVCEHCANNEQVLKNGFYFECWKELEVCSFREKGDCMPGSYFSWSDYVRFGKEFLSIGEAILEQDPMLCRSLAGNLNWCMF